MYGPNYSLLERIASGPNLVVRAISVGMLSSNIGSLVNTVCSTVPATVAAISTTRPTYLTTRPTQYPIYPTVSQTTRPNNNIITTGMQTGSFCLNSDNIND